jgi:hypothetical protein
VLAKVFERKTSHDAHLPCHEADCFHYRGLYNLFAGEYTPCYRIGALGVSVRAEVPTFIDHVVSDCRITLNVGQEGIEQASRDKELEVRLHVEYSKIKVLGVE